MTDISTRAGGRILPSTAYVATDGATVHGSGVPGNPLTASVFTDGTTITGDGTEDNPLVAVGESTTTLQRVNAPGAVSPTIPLTFAHAVGAGLKTFTLADGSTDGFQKTVVFSPENLIDNDHYHLAANYKPVPGYTVIGFPASGGGVILVWDDTNNWWDIVATFGGTPA